MENTLGKRIAALRRQKELTAGQSRTDSGCQPQAVKQMGNDQTCRISVCFQLAKTLTPA